MRATLEFLVKQAGEDLGLSSDEITQAQRPDAVHNYDLGDGVLASRTIHRAVPDETEGLLLSQGGTRVEIFPDGEPPDMNAAVANSWALATNQTLKNITAGLQEGGAKADILIPRSIFRRKGGLRGVLRAYVIRHAGPIKQGDGHGPDMNLTAEDMDFMAATLVGVTHDQRYASHFTGKSVDRGGGIPGRDDGTSYSLRAGLWSFSEKDDFSLDGLRVAIEGSGNVGYNFARLAQEVGIRVMGMSDENQAVVAHDLKGRGLRLDRDIRFAGKDIAGFDEDLARSSAQPGDLHELDVDLFVFAGPSGSMTVGKGNIGKLAARRTIFGANTPLDRHALQWCEESGVVVYPDIVTNFGGVLASSIERHHGTVATKVMVRDAIDKAMLIAIERTVSEASGPTDYLRAAQRVALQDLRSRDKLAA